MKYIRYSIHDIDYYEKDALLKVGNCASFYFQWSDNTREPTLKDALDYIFKDPYKITMFIDDCKETAHEDMR